MDQSERKVIHTAAHSPSLNRLLDSFLCGCCILVFDICPGLADAMSLLHSESSIRVQVSLPGFSQSATLREKRCSEMAVYDQTQIHASVDRGQLTSAMELPLQPQS
jgi:hypothetical protein